MEFAHLIKLVSQKYIYIKLQPKQLNFDVLLHFFKGHPIFTIRRSEYEMKFRVTLNLIEI